MIVPPAYAGSTDFFKVRKEGLPSLFFSNMNVEASLRDLVAIDSVASRANAEIISYLTERCESAGFVIKSFSHIDESGAEKINLLALAGTAFSDSPQVELALVGHTDTVPYDRQWTEAL